MKKYSLIFCLVCLALAIVILVFADGLKRFYSGGFFLMIAVVIFLASRRVVAGTGASVSSNQEESASSPGDLQKKPEQ